MNRKVLTISFFLLCIMGFAVILTACSRNCFVGSRTVETHHAKGAVYIQQKGEKKDAH